MFPLALLPVAGPRSWEPPAPHHPPSIAVVASDEEWTDAIRSQVGDRDISVAIGLGRRIRFILAGGVPRLPASNEKLLTSMAAFDAWGSAHRFPTIAGVAHRPRSGVVVGDLWVVGSGDPELTSGRLGGLAARLRTLGITRITGSVIGDRRAFDRGWWAPGWIPGLSRSYVTRTTALAIDGNRSKTPELTVARAVTDSLRRWGVRVDGAAATGTAPSRLLPLGRIGSAPLADIVRRQNHDSINFDAEMLTKALGGVDGSRGSTRSGADAIEAWAGELGIHVRALDGSGLSHRDRITTASMVRLLLLARREPWGPSLVASLPEPGEGTLADRMAGLPVHAKTGTLFVTPVSALSGYVRDADGRLVAFSVISRGLDKATAISVEDSIVRIVTAARVG
jgi:D-alanyl-D-alanine carboxypeptidase